MQELGKPFYETFGDMYHVLTDPYPWLEPYSPIVAFGLAKDPAYMLTRGLQAISRYGVDKVFPGFHEHVLPKLETICQVGIPLATTAGLLFSQEFREVFHYHSTYTGGWLGIYYGGNKAVKHGRNLRKWEKEAKENNE